MSHLCNMNVHCLILKTLSLIPIVRQVIPVQVKRKSKITSTRGCEKILLLILGFRGHSSSSVKLSEPHISQINYTNHLRHAGEQTVIRILEIPLQPWSCFFFVCRLYPTSNYLHFSCPIIVLVYLQLIRIQV